MCYVNGYPTSFSRFCLKTRVSFGEENWVMVLLSRTPKWLTEPDAKGSGQNYYTRTGPTKP